MTPELLVANIEKARKLFNQHTEEAKGTEDVTQFVDHVKLYRFEHEGVTYRIFGALKEDQMKVDYDKLRQNLPAEMGIDKEAKFDQIVGETNAYSLEGTDRCKAHLNYYLKQNPKNAFLWGLTGKSIDKTRLSANTLVNTLLDTHPELAKRFIANIVDFHTVQAITKWGCKISENIVNFYLIYSANEPKVLFGDDVPSSDNLTNNTVICFDGGIQSLRQALYMMKRNIHVQAQTHLREISEAIHTDPNTQLPYLSAAKFLEVIAVVAKNPEATAEDREKAIDEYLKIHVTHNIKAPDASTKLGLWELALADLRDGDFWKTIPTLFTVVNTVSPKEIPVAATMTLGFANKPTIATAAPATQEKTLIASPL